MKRTLIVTAIILAVGIPAAITANRYWAAGDDKAPVKTMGECPVQEPASAVSSPKDGASCPYMAGKTGHAATKPHVPVSKPVPAVKETRPPAKPVESAVCPVMKTRIPDVTKAAGHSVYKGKTYYFCCAGCKPLFDKDPAKYVNQ